MLANDRISAKVVRSRPLILVRTNIKGIIPVFTEKLCIHLIFYDATDCSNYRDSPKGLNIFEYLL